ncbi:cupin domain-containing protein [Thalassotalea mangrovi]|uniref:Cupin domain-containing protein n=1 Tax=Thalassotalea mangrovi TaxID=2572245 RepID=A0A4U1B3J8_9GAMM|nr:cupin domain-containing protein [Thalassotalea mangrovi]TKB43755.1 cupin domain-containing protein [Thalassotalea mangrovi]
MIIDWKDLSPELFLEQYWQKKPLLIKGAFANFIDPVAPDELAGLAMEDMIESRIVQHRDNKWHVDHGPFDDFESYGDNQWTLLVQAVNHWFEDVDSLISPFRFIPNWRIDDVMVSFSTPGGGVGAHVDQYDVFIIQGSGKRQWRVGKPDSTLQTLVPHPDLKQVSAFESCIDVTTEAGDLLYIPPHHPHDGIAIDNAMNYSVGFQAPNPQELIGGLADYMLDEDIYAKRIDDSQRLATSQPELFSDRDLQLLKQQMQNVLDNDDVMENFLGQLLTSVHHALDVGLPEQPISIEEIPDIIEQIIEDDGALEPVLGFKTLLIEQRKLFINGERFTIYEDTLDLALALANKQHLNSELLKSALSNLKNLELLTRVINIGLWQLA